jgi:hypothetical protein
MAGVVRCPCSPLHNQRYPPPPPRTRTPPYQIQVHPLPLLPPRPTEGPRIKEHNKPPAPKTISMLITIVEPLRSLCAGYSQPKLQHSETHSAPIEIRSCRTKVSAGCFDLDSQSSHAEAKCSRPDHPTLRMDKLRTPTDFCPEGAHLRE